MRVLVAEDESVSALLLGVELRRWGHETVIVSNGNAAWEALQRPDAPPVALIDWMMPGMSGPEVCRLARQLPTEPYLILCTALSEKTQVITGLEAGANDYITKPFNLAELRARLNVGIRMVELQQRLAQANAELEQRVAERTAELETSVKELQAFAYTVGHDLRSPLRVMHGFAEVLKREAHLSAAGGEVLTHLSSCSLRFGRLVDALLAYTRLGHQPLQREQLAPEAFARRALARLEAARTGREVELTLAELPACEGDPGMVEQLYEELLKNALQFTAGRAPARIELGSVVQEGETRYFVRDNGVGFDAARAPKAFALFHQLQLAATPGGPGAGLAFAQRIVQRHHGRIWAESAPDQGATFWFTLAPATQPERNSYELGNQCPRPAAQDHARGHLSRG